MTLHEAILKVLKTNNKAMTARDITHAINNYGLYKREDQEPISVSQVWARINNYADTLFIIDDDKLIHQSEGYSIEFDGMINAFRGVVLQRDYEGKSMEALLTILLIDYYLHPENYVKKKHESFRDHLVDIIESIKGYEIEDQIYNRFVSDNHQLWKDDYQFLEDCFNKIRHLFETCSQYQTLALIRKYIQQNRASEKEIEYSYPNTTLLSEYVSRVANFSDGQTVFDPLAHNSSLLPALAFGKANINIEIWSYRLVGRKYDIFELMLSKKNFKLVYDSDPFKISNASFYDRIITIPPFGYIPIEERKRAGNSYPYIYEKLNSSGKAIMIVDESFLYASYGESNSFIRFLLLNNALKAVVSLPKEFYKNRITAAFIIEKSNPNEVVFFGDYGQFSAEEFSYRMDELVAWQTNVTTISGITCAIKAEELVAKDIIDLTPRKAILNLQLSAELPQGYRKLKDLVLKRIPGKTIPASELNFDHEGIPYLRISDISGDPDFTNLISPPQKYISYQKRPKAVGEEWEIDDKSGRIGNAPKVNAGTLVLARLGANIKATIYDYEEPAIPSHHLLCLELNTLLVHPSYLASEFYADYVKRQLATIQITGVGAPRFLDRDLLELKIRVPSLEEQQRLMFDKREKMMAAFFSKEKASKNVQVQQQEKKSGNEREIISTIQHRVAQFVSPISGDIKNLRFYYQRKSEQNAPLNLEDRISERKGAATISQAFDRIEKNLLGIADTFRLMTEVLFYDRDSTSFKNTDVFDLITEASSSVQDRVDGIELIHESWLTHEGDKTVPLASNQVVELLRNFYINSIRHGFNKAVDPKNVIFIRLTKSVNGEYLELHLINNGTPFPDGFTKQDFISFGVKGGQSEGTGIGGYLMNKIVENHNGKFEWLCDDRLPISIDLEEGTLKIIANVYFKISLPYIN